MTEQDFTTVTDPATLALAAETAAEFEVFLAGLRAVVEEGQPGQAISLLLLEVSRVFQAGARLGAQWDFEPRAEYQPDVGPDPDYDDLRLGLARLLGEVDTYSFVFDPYVPEVVDSQLSDDLTSIATELENGLRHYARGDITEALWWWQFSFVASWGNLAGAALNALITVVAHDRLDAEVQIDADQVQAAREMLESTGRDPG